MTTSPGKPRVIHLAPYPYYGGVQEFASQLSHRLNQPLVGLGDPDAYKTPNTVIVRADANLFRAPLPLRPATLRRLMRLLEPASLVHLHGPFPLVGDLVLLRRKHPVVYQHHYDIEMRSPPARLVAAVYRSIERLAVSKARLVIASSWEWVQESRILRRVPREKIRVLPLGVDTESLTPSPWEGSREAVFAGRIIPEKGVHYLIRAAAILAERGVLDRLHIVGSPVDHSYFERLRDLAAKTGAPVVFHGFLPRQALIETIRRADTLVLPSTTRLESHGIVLLEAAALGRIPVSTTAVAGARYMASHGCGVLARPGDHESLAAAIEEALSAGQSMARACRRLVERRHSWSIVARIALEIYREAAES